ncbi:MAG: DUF5615 family PIN-like protein [Microthrixaceae bacterium]|nr:DUF5615 family PIN-like protein [Microthrixaceae bacterium]
MKLLLDQNLSRHLVRHLRDVFPESEHVSDLGLDGACRRGDPGCTPREHGHLIAPEGLLRLPSAGVRSAVRRRRCCGCASATRRRRAVARLILSPDHVEVIEAFDVSTMTKRCWCSRPASHLSRPPARAGSQRRAHGPGHGPIHRVAADARWRPPSVGADDDTSLRLDVTVPADAEPGQAAFTVIPPDGPRG